MPNELYWLDLETTGLDPNKHQILEVAVMKTSFTKPQEMLKIYQAVVRHDVETGDGKYFLDDEPLDDFIVRMHTQNGLLEEVASPQSLPLAAIEAEICQMVTDIPQYEDKPCLAGSSVHFDAGFLKVHMPTLAKRFHHRHYDISAVKLFCESRGMPKIPKGEAHRAIADIQESMRHMMQCLNWLREVA